MITVADFAKKKGISEQAVYYLIKTKKVSSFKFGKTFVIIGNEHTEAYKPNPKRKNCGRRL